MDPIIFTEASLNNCHFDLELFEMKDGEESPQPADQDIFTLTQATLLQSEASQFQYSVEEAGSLLISTEALVDVGTHYLRLTLSETYLQPLQFSPKFDFNFEVIILECKSVTHDT